jgi:hypothetical protein
MSNRNDPPQRGDATEVARSPWRRPTLRRMNTNQADHGIVGGGDTPGADKMS